MPDVINQLHDLLGPKGILLDEDITEKYSHDVMGVSLGQPLAVLRPQSTEEVSAALKLCHQHQQPLCVHGGNTGLVLGGVPLDGEIVISLERMNKIEDLDPNAATMSVQAGAVLQQVQEAADDADFMFPLDLGARGSCTIGGNISTNAGGNRVLRYGMMRDMVLGLEVVMPDGTVMNAMNTLIKNNTGIDLKQLMIGAEGTLGIITGAVLQLQPKPKIDNVALSSLDSFEQVLSFFSFMRAKLPGLLSAYELMWKNFYDYATGPECNISAPLPNDSAFYVLTEIQGGQETSDLESFENALAEALEMGLITNAVIAQSASQAQAIWDVRDASGKMVEVLKPAYSYDISVAPKQMEACTKAFELAVNERWPDSTTVLFGHIGDGNIHIVTNANYGNNEIHELLYELVGKASGSISAEHGIGMAKRKYLHHSRSAVELAMMRDIKQTLDPNCILNPGRVLNQ